MIVNSLMTSNPSACHAGEMLQVAARLMWENDCGAVPVVDEHGRVIGIVTDRDICMAAYTQGRPLWTIPIETAMSKAVVTCHADEDVGTAEMIMREARVRRLPVVNREGTLVGMLSLNDLARAAATERSGDDAPRAQDLAHTLATIGESRATARPSA